MIDKDLLRRTVDELLAGTDVYLTDLRVAPGNDITVEIDSAEGVDIATCERITRGIEEAFDREVEDYSLEVGSAGITSPLKVRAQFVKNIGGEMEVLTKDGRKLRGTLVEVAPGEPLDTDVAFTIEVQVKVKEPGAKRPVVRAEALTFSSMDCKYVRPEIKF
ncbi:MAG: ribosome assembly cofactor RimP [Muribaculaceae bacterium]|nr:ribosome assembly cofactor RimP [Muribaculaceae bacterium]